MACNATSYAAGLIIFLPPVDNQYLSLGQCGKDLTVELKAGLTGHNMGGKCLELRLRLRDSVFASPAGGVAHPSSDDCRYGSRRDEQKGDIRSIC